MAANRFFYKQFGDSNSRRLALTRTMSALLVNFQHPILLSENFQRASLGDVEFGRHERRSNQRSGGSSRTTFCGTRQQDENTGDKRSRVT